MVRRRFFSAVSNHECREPSFETRKGRFSGDKRNYAHAGMRSQVLMGRSATCRQRLRCPARLEIMRHPQYFGVMRRWVGGCGISPSRTVGLSRQARPLASSCAPRANIAARTGGDCL